MQYREINCRWTARASLVALAFLLAGNANAQEAPEANDPPAAAGEGDSGTASAANDVIIVSGSRAIVDGTNAPTPVTVMSNEQLKTASPSSLIDGLNQLPVFASSIRPNSTGSSGSGQGGNGGNYLNLRALLPTRTLVLLDGRRTVASSIQTNATDVTLFPQMLISRVDVVTGGASAAYGSDAVAGVVNFIVDTKFSGIRAEAQSGISTYGDGFSYRVGVAGGQSFADDRGHIIASFEHARTRGIDNASARDWAATGYGIIPSTIAQSGTTQIFAPDVRLNGATFGGTIQSCLPAGATCPIANMFFNPDGTLSPFVRGDYAGSSVASGGSGAAVRTNITTGNWTNTAYLRAQYEFSDAIKLFAEGIYGDVNTEYLGAPSNITSGSTALTIFADNAFLPDAVRSVMTANGITSFRMGRANKEIAPNRIRTNTKTWRGVAGIEGSLGGSWTYSLALERSRAHYQLFSRSNLIVENFFNGADSVIDPATNLPVCRSTLLGLPQGEGCVAIDLFGENSASADAIAYAAGTAKADLYLNQTNVMLDFRGSPLDTWAGPVSLAFGAEYRKETALQRVDAISGKVKSSEGIRGFPTSANGQPGGFALSNPQPIEGEFSVKEAYAEIVVPLARDVPFLYSLDLNGAVRYADYSNVGGVWTWKIGATWEPISAIRLRATRSRDIRAAGIAELFTASQQTAGLSARDTTLPGAPAVAPITRQTRGNPGLQPEVADTVTAGIVVTPVAGVNLSVDYYSIKIDGAITQSTLQQVIDGCAAGNAELCGLITRDGPGGSISSIVTPFLNLAQVKTSGLDIEASYRTDLGDGQLSLRMLANHTFELETTNEGITVDRAGDMGLRDAVAKWTLTGSVSYASAGGTTVFVQGRYLSGGKYDSTLGPTALPVEQNHVPAVFYADATLKQRIGEPANGIEMFLTVNNLFNRKPPLAPQGAVTIPRQTNPYFYDMVGRYYTVGARARF
ncbi:MAG TPA: TonB-dependent receptor [Sphingopyxis sp.]|uniref:TonB-dependent receptor domain-containing protein n=1 Tax=Sphingopyxis sp. TaxID=1908224 RepID=UPI002C423DDB|nr:TonB-dependent receptor [Sphingopyxis sp.]HWW55844.1 TonB-dependent receptor [Sphingopyxis sp.]